MKKSLIISLVAIATLALASSAFAVIENSHHDMGAFGGFTKLSTCEYCHTPHNAVLSGASTNAPLWNRNNPAASDFTPYGDTLGGSSVTTVGTNSLTCLSCHDGTVGVLATTANGKGETGGTVTARANVGANLQDDHPVGFVFTDGNAGVSQARMDSVGPLYGASNTFECASCHDPHDSTTGATPESIAGDGANSVGGSGYFLRAPHSTICTDCHLK